MKKCVIIVGPTASGKSDLAVQVAQAGQGCVVNADSMQIYRDLRLISARPTPAQTALVPHFLYGYADAYTPNSVQDWLNRVVPVLQVAPNPVIVGGTGLYITALINGLNTMPDIPPEIRTRARQTDLQDIHKCLPEFPYTDPQRLRRAYEVWLATGKPISYFQNQPKHSPFPADYRVIFIQPPRDQLYDRCDRRFHQMIEQGGIEEVRHLMSLHPTGGVLKAIGVPEIMAYLNGELTRDQMITQALLSTRHYAKRQLTWFRHQIRADHILTDPSEFCADMIT